MTTKKHRPSPEDDDERPCSAALILHAEQCNSAVRADGLKRIEERKEREALEDKRTAAQVFLGDPPTWRSALAQAHPPQSKYQPNREDIATVMAFGKYVGDLLRAEVRLPFERVRLPKRSTRVRLPAWYWNGRKS